MQHSRTLIALILIGLIGGGSAVFFGLNPFLGVWAIQPMLGSVVVNNHSGTLAPFTAQFDADGPLSGHVVEGGSFPYGMVVQDTSIPAIAEGISDVVEIAAPAAQNGITPHWYQLTFTVRTLASWGYAPSAGAGTASNVAAGELPMVDYATATVTSQFTVTLRNFNMTEWSVEKVRIDAASYGMQPYANWDQAQADMNTWAPNSIAGTVVTASAGGANLITRISSDRTNVTCSLTTNLKAAARFTPSTWNGLARTANAAYTVHDVSATYTLILQLLDAPKGNPGTAVPWWVSLVAWFTDFITRVRSGAEQLADILFIVGICVIILATTLILAWAWSRKGRRRK